MAPTRVTGQQVGDGQITDADVAAANKDGGDGTPCLRTLGTGAGQARPGAQALTSQELPQRHNLLLNGGAWLWTRQAAPATLTNYVDDAYFADRWYALLQGAQVQAAQSAGSKGPYALKLSQLVATAQRIGCAQIVEYRDSYPFRSRPVRLQFAAKCSATTTLRYAILEWTGGADAVTSDVVSDWTSATYTAGNFFIANVVAAATAGTSVGAAYVPCAVSGTVSAACNNLLAMVWTEAAAAQNVTVEVSDLTLCDDALARDWLPRPVPLEEAACRRFAVGYALHPLGLAAGGNNLYGYGALDFQPPMRAAPSLLAGATFAVNAGSAGTPALQNGWPGGVSVFNAANNWTVNALVKLTGILDAEL